ncbi:MAG: hypothetical protein GEV28_08800 [Actinophytocola sp.]|uniref:hypothetical protein n=1 Tax=Actinophytocola sp. TaxID=1872138 RepID=UPI0013229A06|nr:hypothetical protein [Actinophytocola sp.]MPZ80476.1 hypothetical protein [Actinophytocola sp.]
MSDIYADWNTLRDRFTGFQIDSDWMATTADTIQQIGCTDNQVNTPYTIEEYARRLANAAAVLASYGESDTADGLQSQFAVAALTLADWQGSAADGFAAYLAGATEMSTVLWQASGELAALLAAYQAMIDEATRGVSDVIAAANHALDLLDSGEMSQDVIRGTVSLATKLLERLDSIKAVPQFKYARIVVSASAAVVDWLVGGPDGRPIFDSFCDGIGKVHTEMVGLIHGAFLPDFNAIIAAVEAVAPPSVNAAGPDLATAASFNYETFAPSADIAGLLDPASISTAPLTEDVAQPTEPVPAGQTTEPSPDSVSDGSNSAIAI